MIHLGTEQTVTVDGKRRRLSRFTRAIFREWLNWAAAQVPSPMAAAGELLDLKLADDVRSELLWELVRLNEDTGTMADREIQKLWLSNEGQVYALELLLNKHHFDDAPDLAARLAATHDAPKLIETAQGRYPIDAVAVIEGYQRARGLLAEQDTGESIPPNWAKIDREIMQHLHVTPTELDAMTLSEIAILWLDGKTLVSTEVIRYVLGKFPVNDQVELARQIWR